MSTEKVYDLAYYVKSALAGGICCSVTHAAMCPVDVVKTRIQMDPIKYNRGMIGEGKRIVYEEVGMKGLYSGVGATAVGYFVQGWFKFGGVEFFKVQASQYLGDQKAWEYRTIIYLAAAACAEFIADIFLCPLEATRIRSVSNPEYGGLLNAFPKILQQDGVRKGFYAGFGPILFKQIPYTMAKFAVQGAAAEKIATAGGIDMSKAADSTKLSISLTSGVIAGVAAAIISHPADTLLSMINKSPTAGGTGSIASRLANLAKETGFKKLCLTGLGPRCVMIGSLTAGQFGIFDITMQAVGAEKFHFHDPNVEKKH